MSNNPDTCEGNHFPDLPAEILAAIDKYVVTLTAWGDSLRTAKSVRTCRRLYGKNRKALADLEVLVFGETITR